MQVLDMILDVLAYIWYGIKRIFKNPVLRDAAIILLSVLVSVLVINARTKSINEQAEKRIAAIEQRYQSGYAGFIITCAVYLCVFTVIGSMILSRCDN